MLCDCLIQGSQCPVPEFFHIARQHGENNLLHTQCRKCLDTVGIGGFPGGRYINNNLITVTIFICQQAIQGSKVLLQPRGRQVKAVPAFPEGGDTL